MIRKHHGFKMAFVCSPVLQRIMDVGVEGMTCTLGGHGDKVVSRCHHQEGVFYGYHMMALLNKLVGQTACTRSWHHHTCPCMSITKQTGVIYSESDQYLYM